MRALLPICVTLFHLRTRTTMQMMMIRKTKNLSHRILCMTLPTVSVEQVSIRMILILILQCTHGFLTAPPFIDGLPQGLCSLQVLRRDGKLSSRRCARFRHALASMPIPHWHVDIDDHAALYEQQVPRLSQQFFAKKPAKTRLIPLQPDTLDAIAFKRQILDLGRSTGEITDAALKLNLRSSSAKSIDWSSVTFRVSMITFWSSFNPHHRLVYRILQRLGRRKLHKRT